MNAVINAVKDGYLYAIEFIAKHPHAWFWAVIAVLLLFVAR